MNKFKSESPSSIEDHLTALCGRINYEKQDRATPRHFKLRNMREILQRLDNPQLKYPVVHVAGTKGKGSVCTMVGQILSTSGRRTGVYTSPHLESIHQRMAVDGVLITDDQLLKILTMLDPVVQQMDKEAEQQQHRPLTFFEITTAAAFLFFATQKCEVVVLEVGLGGRLDSTNVCQPVTSVITNISVDHTRQLGSTVDKIAFEKAGIIKPGVPVVSGALDPAAAKVIEEVANSQQSPYFVLQNDFFLETPEGTASTFSCSGTIDVSSNSLPASKSDFTGPAERIEYGIDNLKLGLIGHHQRTNASVAVAAIQTLVARGWDISDDSIRTGLRRASLSGRTEVVSQSPTIIIDMAHNVASINALVDALTQDLPQWKSSSRRTLILAMSRDKDAVGILRPLVENFDEIVLTKYQNNPRGKSENELLKLAQSIQSQRRANSQPAADLVVESTPDAAWQRVESQLGENQLVCISGSAFLVAEMRNSILASIDQTLPEIQNRT